MTDIPIGSLVRYLPPQGCPELGKTIIGLTVAKSYRDVEQNDVVDVLWFDGKTACRLKLLEVLSPKIIL